MATSQDDVVTNVAEGLQSPRVRVHGVSWEEGSVGEAQRPELNS